MCALTRALAGVWKVTSKLVLIVVMMLGRHRGLPDNIDSAVSIPKKGHFKKGKRRSLTGVASVKILEDVLNSNNSRSAAAVRRRYFFFRAAFSCGLLARSLRSPATGRRQELCPFRRNASASNLSRQKRPNVNQILEMEAFQVLRLSPPP
eukprot:jgi/Mesen1/6780/ME000348S06059